MKNEFDFLNDVKMDFSNYEAMKLTESERATMKQAVKKKSGKRISWKKCALIAACAATIAAMSQTAFAQELMGKIIQSISTGYNTFVQMEEPEGVTVSVPDQLAGQIYDKEGRVMTKIGRQDKLYDREGNEVMIQSEMTQEGEQLFLFPVDKMNEIPESDESSVIYSSVAELESVLDFDLKTPESLPQGYHFLYGEAFRTEKNSDEISGEYAFLAYSNGEKTFFLHERMINEANKFVSSLSGELKTIQIHGHTAAMGDREISWEEDGISVSILGRDAVTGDDLIKLAESIQ